MNYGKVEEHVLEASQQTRDIVPMLVQCWSTVYDAGPTLNQQWDNVSCLLGCARPYTRDFEPLLGPTVRVDFYEESIKKQNKYKIYKGENPSSYLKITLYQGRQDF